MSVIKIHSYFDVNNSPAVKSRTIVEYVVLGILCLTLFENPFEVTDTLTFFSLVSSIVVGVVGVILALIPQRTSVKGVNAMDNIMIVFILYTIVRFLVQRNFYILNEKFLLVIGFAIYYFLIRKAKPNINHICNFLVILYSINLSLGLFGISGLLRGYLFSWASENSAMYSIYIAGFIPVVLYRAYCTSHRAIKLLLLLLAIGGVGLLYKLESRTAWVALGCSLCFMGLYMTGWFRGKRMILLPVLMITLSIIMSAALYSYKKDSSDGRLFIYGNTMDMIGDAILSGHGFETFKVKYLDYQAKYFSENTDDTKNSLLADNTRTAFNDYMLVWAEQGIWAIIMLFAAFFLIMRNINRNNIAFICGLCVFAISSCFSYPMYSAPCGMLAMLYLGCTVNSEKTVNAEKIHKGRKQIFIGSLCALYTFLSISNFVLYAAWDNAYKKVLALDYSGFSAYNRIHPYMSGNGGFLFNYGSELFFAGNFKHSAHVLDSAKPYFNDNLLYLYLGESYMRQRSYSLAEEHYIHAIDMVPNRFYPRYKLLQLYEETGRESDAKDVAKEIMDCQVKIPSNTIDMIREYAKEKLNE